MLRDDADLHQMLQDFIQLGGSAAVAATFVYIVMRYYRPPMPTSKNGSGEQPVSYWNDKIKDIVDAGIARSLDEQRYLSEQLKNNQATIINQLLVISRSLDELVAYTRQQKINNR